MNQQQYILMRRRRKALSMFRSALDEVYRLCTIGNDTPRYIFREGSWWDLRPPKCWKSHEA